MRDAPNDDILISPDAQCFGDIHEQMGFIIISAEIIQRCCELGDAPAVHYQLKRMATAFRSAGTSYSELAAHVNAALDAQKASAK